MVHFALLPVRPAVPVAAALAGVALCGLALAAGALPAPDAEPPFASVGPSQPAAATNTALTSPTCEARPGPMSFVFHAGGATYLQLADLDDGDGHADAIAAPRHGAPRLFRGSDGIVAAIAAVAADDLPPGPASWQGKQFDVDEVCTASVVGFAVVSRQIAPRREVHAARWTAPQVMASGHAVLAARLDGCIGSYARDR